MCGIVGIIGESAKNSDVLDAMARSIFHRGPDHTGLMREESVALAMTRLSIIDIAGGSQPMHSKGGEVSLVFNGEIYNYRELRKELESLIEFKTNSDTEVILNGYCVWGDSIFAKLNGMFAIAIFDRTQNLVSLVRDPMGIKPLYYSRIKESLYFSSELKTFTFLDLANKPNLNAVHNFLATDYVFHPQSAINEVLQVSPGNIFKINIKGEFVSEVCFRLPGVDLLSLSKKKQNLSRAEAVLAIRKSLEAAVLRQTVSDVPYGLLLSSGLDSMAILGVLKKYNLTKNLKTYTLYFPDSASYSEDKPISQLASNWGFESNLIPLESRDVISHFDDMCATFDNLEMLPTCMAIYFASKVAGKDLRVLLSGNGGDEIFFGYPTYRATDLVRRLQILKGPLLKALPILGRLINPSDDYLTLKEKVQRFCYGFSGDPCLSHLQWRHVFTAPEINKLLKGTHKSSSTQKIYQNQLKHYEEARKFGFTGPAADSWADIRSWLVDSGLSMWDKAGMSASTEIRVPLIDLDFIDQILALPTEIRSGGDLGSKKFFKDVLSGIVPENILNLPKHGFQLPIAGWLRGDLGIYLRELVRELPQQVFDHREIDRLWMEFDRRRGNHALKLWTLGVLAGWSRAQKIAW